MYTTSRIKILNHTKVFCNILLVLLFITFGILTYLDLRSVTNHKFINLFKL